MTDEEILQKIQAVADETAQRFIFKKNAQLDLIYTETKEDGTIEAYVLGSDMPRLIYRIFELAPDGSVKENNNIKEVVEKTKHYNVDIKPTLKLVPPAVEELDEYSIIIENSLPDHAVELKLKSSVGRTVTMIETYRYFDYVSKFFFVSCVSASFGGQYLFTVSSDGKHVKLVLGNNEDLKKRIDMITELLQARLLPSYQTIQAGTHALSNPDVRARVEFQTNEGKATYLSNFCYDDVDSGNMFAFFVKENDNKNGLMFIRDIVTDKLTLAQAWTDEQKAAAERVQKALADSSEEGRRKFTEHVHSFFADSLDLRYAAFKSGILTLEALNKAKEEQQAPATENN